MGDGESHVIRNAGGVVTDDVIRSLAVSQRLLGTTEIILIHHTDCGLQKITDEEFKREVEADTGIRPPWAVEAFTDAAADVRQSIGRLRPARSSRARTRSAASCSTWRRAGSTR